MAVRKLLALVAPRVRARRWCGGACRLARVERHSRAVQGLRRPSSSSSIRQGAASGEIGRSLADAQHRQRRAPRSAPRSGGPGRDETQGGRVSVRPRGDATRGRRRAGARRGLHAADHVSRRADDRGDVEAVRRRTASAARAIRRSGAARRARSPISIRTRPISKAISFPKPTRCREERRAARLIDVMVDRFRPCTARRCGHAPRHAGLTTRQVVTLASLVEKETGKPRNGPSWRRCIRNRLKIGMPMQADPDGRSTRCRRRDSTTATSAATIWRSIRRTTPIDTRACRPAPSPRRARRRSRPRCMPGRRAAISISSAATTARTCSRRRSPSTTATSGSFRSSISGAAARAAGGQRCSLALAPLQLLAQELEVAARRRLDQPKHRSALSDADRRRPAAAGYPDCPSKVTNTSSPLRRSWAGRRRRAAGNHDGRLVSVCGAIGVSTSASTRDARSVRRRPGCRPWILSASR